MRIAFVLYPEAIVINKTNGIRNQALKWSDSLAGLADVDLISPWDEIDWRRYDAINFFGGTQWLGFVPDLRILNDNVVFSPILDSIESVRKLKFLANLSFKGYHHPVNMYKQYLHSFKKILVRSDYEAYYINKCFGVKYMDIVKIPISYEINPELPRSDKEDFCLHVSALYQDRKNVRRLVEASKKYKFKLILAGNPGNGEQQEEIMRWVDGTKWIEVKGFVNQIELENLYRRAKVFALPSVNEGVGIVALNGAVAGCHIVLTKLGGPKEYFGNYAYLVDPYDIDDIGRKVMEAMQSPCNDDLRSHIISNYSQETIGKNLFQFYESLSL